MIRLAVNLGQLVERTFYSQVDVETFPCQIIILFGIIMKQHLLLDQHHLTYPCLGVNTCQTLIMTYNN